MANKTLELVFILDRSGSMCGMEEATVKGFNSILEQQRKIGGKVLVSTVLFDSVSEVLHNRTDLQRVRAMEVRDFQVRGCTALCDAVGAAIDHIGRKHKYAHKVSVPDHTLFVIMTDGGENASRKYSADRIREMIRNQQTRFGWEFLFMGANINAVETARDIGIAADCAADYVCDEIGTDAVYSGVNEAICSKRTCGKVGSVWRKNIDSDYKNRR